MQHDTTPSDLPCIAEDGHLVPVFEAMRTARAMRYYRPDPVPDDVVESLVWAATRATSPNNAQCWDFLVVTDAEQRARIAEAIQAAYPRRTPEQLPADPSQRRSAAGADHLIGQLASVPVLVFVLASPYPADAPILEFMYSAVFAAAQNLLVAARSLGLGSAFTTLHRRCESELRELLKVPDDRLFGVTMPLGWPARNFGPVNRQPVADCLHRNVW